MAGALYFYYKFQITEEQNETQNMPQYATEYVTNEIIDCEKPPEIYSTQNQHGGQNITTSVKWNNRRSRAISHYTRIKIVRVQSFD